jgi:hypothetical protein
MHEVVIERPRWGSSRGYPRAYMLNRCRDADAPPQREAMGRYYREKSLSDNLAPLRRYLRSNAGRPWSKVRSEMSAHLRVTSAVQKHIFDHVARYICERTFLRDGAVWGADAYGRPRLFGGADFYVHPRSGHLVAAPHVARKLKSRLRVPNPDVRTVRGHFLRRIDGEWYEVDLARMPAPAQPVWDAFAQAHVWSHSYHHDAHAVAQWKRCVFARSLRLLSKRERYQLLSR